MAKRYVYWLTPEGKPYPGNDDKYAPTKSLAKLGEFANVKDGQVTWSGFFLDPYETVIRAAVIVLDGDGNELNKTDAWSITWKAIVSVIKARGSHQPIAPGAFRREADKKAAAYLRNPQKDYVLRSSLSVKTFPARLIKINECVVSPILSRGAQFPFPDALKRQVAMKTAIGKHLIARKYQMVRVKTSGRSIHEAANNAFTALNLLQGVWNLFATHGRWSISVGSMKSKPLGVIHNGPVHTLHLPDGTPAEDLFWYEPDYVEDHDLFRDNNKWANIEKYRRWAMARIKRLPYQKDLKELIIRYATALSSTDLDVAFLRMWSILEQITNTVGARYEQTIERAAWVFDDRSLAKEHLEALRRRRNLYVHAARSDRDRDQIAYLVKSLLDPHLFHVIRNSFGVQSLEEHGQCLAFSTSVETLSRRRKQLSRAIKMRTKQSS